MIISTDPLNGLELKSSSTAYGTNLVADTVLCTDDKTYRLRQKNSSNSVYILEIAPSQTGAIAIAQCQSTLELSSHSGLSASHFIRQLVPLYSSTGSTASGGPANQRELFDSIPLSERECQIAYEQLAIAIEPSSGRPIMASAEVKIGLWRSMIDGISAEGLSPIDLASETTLRRVLDSAGVEDLVIARAIVTAVGVGRHTDENTFKTQHAVRWLGINLLEMTAMHAAVQTREFLNEWKDLLPEAWRSEADATLLQSYATVEESGAYIRCNPAEYGVGDSSAGFRTTQRKWHERFKTAS